MASGVELGTAYISISASTRGLGKDIAKAVGGPEISNAGKTAGNNISGKIGSVLKKSAVGVGAAAGGILGTALFAGFNRLNQIDKAKKKLGGLGKSTKDVDVIMKNALASVKGTAFGLGDAATVAAGAVAAGIKPGKQLEGVLKTVANTAAASGTSLNEMGSIFNKVATSNKAYNGELQQLADRGVPIYAELAKQLKVPQAEVSKLASQGKISFAQFSKAAEAASGNVAKAMGQTVGGSFDNLKASLGRIGANLLSGAFPLIAPAIQKVTGFLGKFEDKAAGAGEKVGKAFAGLTSLLVKGDFTKNLREAFNVEEDSPFVAFILKVRDGIKGAAAGFKAALPVVLAFAKSVGKDIGSTLKNLAQVFGPLIVQLGSAAFKAAPAVFATLGGALKVVSKTLATVSGFVKSNATLFQSLAVAVGAGLAAFYAIKTVMTVITVTTRAWAAAQALLNVVMSANPIGLVVIALAALVAGLIYAYKNSETFRDIVNGAFTKVKAAAAAVLNFFKTQWPVLLVLLAGPVGLAVLAIIRNWEKIKSATSSAWKAVRNFISSAWAAIQAVTIAKLAAIGAKITAVWASVKSGTSAAWNAVKNYIVGRLTDAKAGIVRVVDSIKSILSNAWASVARTASSAWGKVKSGIGSAWHGVASVIIAPINAVIDVMNLFIRGANALLHAIPGVSLKITPIGHVATPKGFAAGGWTGPGAKYQPAGVVHADEFVIRKESQQSISRHAPGLLDALNRGGASALGYAGGGLVGKGLKALQALTNPAQSATSGGAASIGIDITKTIALLRDLVSGVSGPASLGMTVAKGVASAAGKGLEAVVKKGISAIGLGGGGAVGGAGGAGRWASVAAQAMSMAGLPSSYLPLLLHRINVESGGNPNAINLWDSNAKAGYPSQGLMQTIPGTFNAYAGPLRGLGITNPLANIYAAIKYTLSRYGLGGIGRAWGGSMGYAKGGLVNYAGIFDRGGVLSPGLNLVNNQTGAPERLHRTGAGGDTYNFNGPVGATAAEVARELEQRKRRRDALVPSY